jgi:hypothetical protein
MVVEAWLVRQKWGHVTISDKGVIINLVYA